VSLCRRASDRETRAEGPSHKRCEGPSFLLRQHLTPEDSSPPAGPACRNPRRTSCTRAREELEPAGIHERERRTQALDSGGGIAKLHTGPALQRLVELSEAAALFAENTRLLAALANLCRGVAVDAIQRSDERQAQLNLPPAALRLIGQLLYQPQRGFQAADRLAGSEPSLCLVRRRSEVGDGARAIATALEMRGPDERRPLFGSRAARRAGCRSSLASRAFAPT
jgi:hypothetical protein